MSYETDKIATFLEQQYENLINDLPLDKKTTELLDMIEVGDIDIDEIFEMFDENVFKYYSRFYRE